MAETKVIINMTESEYTELNDNNSVKSMKTTGVLKVINPSAEHRLWNLRMSLANIDFTNLKKENAKESLEPGKEWLFDYEVPNIKEPILKLVETFDTSKSAEGINFNYTLGNADETTIKLSLQNTSSKKIKNIVLKKNLPLYLHHISLGECTLGTNSFTKENRELLWKIESLDPNVVAEFTINAKAEITDVDMKSGEPIEITYESESNIRSEIKPNLVCLTDTMSGIDQEEDDVKPRSWNCELEFCNESDLELTLNAARVLQKVTTGEEQVLDVAPKAVIPPKGSWKNNFSVDSSSVPNLNPKLDFSPNFVIRTKIIGKILQHPKAFPVLKTIMTKVIDPPAVKANANTDMMITNTIENVGTAIVDKLKIKDLVPKDFEPPSIDQFVVEFLNKNGDKIVTLTNKNTNPAVTPADKSSTALHSITVDNWDLSTWFKPGYKLVLKYPIIARSPQPNTNYDTPVEANANVKPHGPGYTCKPDQMPSIGIQYVKRKVKTMKSINPSGVEGAFNITVKITNNGGVEIEHITIVERVPIAFKASEFKPAEIKPNYQEFDDGARITWKIARLDPLQAITLSYVCEGKGEYPRTEPEITYEK